MKDTFERCAVRAFNERDVETYCAGLHDDFAWFDEVVPHLLEGKAQRRRVFENLLRVTTDATFTPLNLHFRAVGDTGIVRGGYEMIFTFTGGATQRRAGRFSCTYTKAGGRWLALAQHYEGCSLAAIR